MKYFKQTCKLIGSKYTPDPTHTDSAGTRYYVRELADNTSSVGPAVVNDINDLIVLDSLPEEVRLAKLRQKCSQYSQSRLDKFASNLGYDNITTLRSAKLSSVPRFHAEGIAGQAAWDAEWGAAQEFIVAVQLGSITATFDNYKTSLPTSFTAPQY
jgi:hypothetical protein